MEFSYGILVVYNASNEEKIIQASEHVSYGILLICVNKICSIQSKSQFIILYLFERFLHYFAKYKFTLDTY